MNTDAMPGLEGHGTAQDLRKAGDKRRGGCLVAVAQQDAELVADDAGQEFGAADEAGHAAGALDKDFVAGGMTVAVDDALPSIQVKGNEGKGLAGALYILEASIEGSIAAGAVGQAGQGIGHRQTGQFLDAAVRAKKGAGEDRHVAQGIEVMRSEGARLGVDDSDGTHWATLKVKDGATGDKAQVGAIADERVELEAAVERQVFDDEGLGGAGEGLELESQAAGDGVVGEIDPGGEPKARLVEDDEREGGGERVGGHAGQGVELELGLSIQGLVGKHRTQALLLEFEQTSF